MLGLDRIINQVAPLIGKVAYPVLFAFQGNRPIVHLFDKTDYRGQSAGSKLSNPLCPLGRTIPVAHVAH